MAAQAKPGVGTGDASKLALESVPYISPDGDDTPLTEVTPTQETVAEVEPTVEETAEPTAEAEPKAEEKPEPKKSKTEDLTKSEAFRKYQAEADRRLEAERQKRLALEQQMQQAEQYRAEMEYRALQGQLNEVQDDRQREAIVRRMARVLADREVAEKETWRSYVRQKVEAEGLDPQDFDPRRYEQIGGERGAMLFERELNEKAREKLRKENESLKRVVSPESIEKIVKQQLARASNEAGLDHVDYGAPTETTGDMDAWERDAAALQSGRMSSQAYAKRWMKRAISS